MSSEFSESSGSAESSRSPEPKAEPQPNEFQPNEFQPNEFQPNEFQPNELQPTADEQTTASEGSSNVLQEPSFLHPSSIVFEVATQVRQYIFPAVIGLFGAASGNAWGVGLAGFAFAISLSKTLMRYFTLRYRIEGGEFILTEGLLFRRVRSVPIHRIQNMDLVQNVLHRMFGVAVVNIETASGSEPEATLRVLTQEQIAELRQAIFGKPAAERNAVAVATNLGDADISAQGHAADQPPASATLLSIPLKDLVIAGLISNRGWVILSVLIGFYFQSAWGGDWGSGQDWRRRTRVPSLTSDTIREYLPEQILALGWVAQIALAAIALWLILRLVGVAWYVLRFQGYQLTRHGDDLRIACGLFTRVSASIPRRRIQFISVHRPWLMRLLGLASVRIETAGGGGAENENAATTVSRRWFIPVVREERVWPMLRELRPELQWPYDHVQWYGVSEQTGRRLLRVVLVLTFVAGAAGLAITRPWGFLVGPVVFPLMYWIARRKARARRFARLPWGVAYHSGLFTRKLSFAFFDRLQTLGWTQSPFDRRWRMASLYVDTAAAGPAEHLIEIDYLDETVAREQFAELQKLAAEHTPVYT